MAAVQAAFSVVSEVAGNLEGGSEDSAAVQAEAAAPVEAGEISGFVYWALFIKKEKHITGGGRDNE